MKVKIKILLLLLAPLLSFGQSAFLNKGGAVYIQQSALVTIKGDLDNENNGSTGSVQNDGILELSGNFKNGNGAQFTYNTNTNSTDRAVKFIGSGKQTISGSMSTAGTSSFYNLVVDQEAASDTVEMDIPLVLQGSLVFGTANITSTYNPTVSNATNNNQKGLFKTFSDSLGEFLLDIQNGNTDAISGFPVLQVGGSPTTGFILTSGTRGSANGGVQRKIASATSYLYPIGTRDKGFEGIRLNFSQIPGNGSVVAKFCSGSSNPTGEVGHLSQYCSGCSGNYSTPTDSGYNRFFTNDACNNNFPQWIIFQTTAKNFGYWSFNSTNTGYHYDVEAFPNSYGNMSTTSTIRVIKHEASYGTDPTPDNVDWRPEIESLVSGIEDLLSYTANAGCYTGSGIPGGTYTDFSHFTLGGSESGGNDNALPVTLLYVNAQAVGKHHITVTWATALEINNAGFYVMRSTDGVNFTDVGWVPGHDNSTVTENYSFDDRPSQSTTYYYKLRQVDNNQHFTYSSIVEASLTDELASNFQLYPNPTSNELFLDVKDPADEVNVDVYNVKGQLVYNNIFTVAAAGAEQTLTINATSILPPGTYILTASTNGEQYNTKVVLQ